MAGRGFTITANFNAEAPDGVIVAQGGVVQGYALFLRGGKLTFLVRARGEATGVAITSTVTGARTAVAQLQFDGTLSLALDGQPTARGRE